MNSKFKYKCTIICLVLVSIVFTVFNYNRNKVLKDAEIKLNNIYMIEKNNITKKFKKHSYSDSISDIQKYSCIKIKKVTNNNHDKVFIMELEFKGEKEKLDGFMDYIKSQKSLYQLKGIQISSKDSKIYSGNITLHCGIRHL